MGCFEVSRPVARRMRIAAELPTEHPVVLDEVQTLLGSLPDPDTLCAEQRAGMLAMLARLGNQIDACLTDSKSARAGYVGYAAPRGSRVTS